MADGTVLDLAALAAEVCARYAAEYPDEHERYGEAGRLWCLHDNQHLLNWAVLDTLGYVVMDEQVAWLAKILEAREFPLDRLARDLDIAAVVVGERVPRGDAVAAALTGAAAMVRSRSTFL
jgi:HEAT repeat protein